MNTAESIRISTASSIRRRFLLAEWDDAQRAALNRYIAATLATLSAMNDLRASYMFAREIERHDRYACDTAAAAIDFISDTVGTLQSRLDYEGGDSTDIVIDTSELCELHDYLKLRADARR